MKGLKGKVALITGGLGDLGKASALRLVEEGCKVAVFDTHKPAAGSKEMAGVRCMQVDITKESEVEEGCKEIASALGPITILVNAAAIFIFKGLEATPEEFHRLFDVNIVGMSLVTKHAVAQMRERGGGTIVNFSSISGIIGQPRFATYNASKFAVRGLTKCWAIDLAPAGIRVNSICPGYIYTAAFERSCVALNLDKEQENKRASAMTLLNRQGRPDEIAAAVAFLASDDASYMTGSELMVEGGYLTR